MSCVSLFVPHEEECVVIAIIDTRVPLAGPDHHPPAAVQDKGRVVQEHTATGMGPTGETPTTFDLQRFSHQEADEEGRADGDQHGHLPCGHL